MVELVTSGSTRRGVELEGELVVELVGRGSYCAYRSIGQKVAVDSTKTE